MSKAQKTTAPFMDFDGTILLEKKQLMQCNISLFKLTVFHVFPLHQGQLHGYITRWVCKMTAALVSWLMEILSLTMRH